MFIFFHLEEKNEEKVLSLFLKERKKVPVIFGPFFFRRLPFLFFYWIFIKNKNIFVTSFVAEEARGRDSLVINSSTYSDLKK